jgi:hypothetical protein
VDKPGKGGKVSVPREHCPAENGVLSQVVDLPGRGEKMGVKTRGFSVASIWFIKVYRNEAGKKYLGKVTCGTPQARGSGWKWEASAQRRGTMVCIYGRIGGLSGNRRVVMRQYAARKKAITRVLPGIAA